MGHWFYMKEFKEKRIVGVNIVVEGTTSLRLKSFRRLPGSPRDPASDQILATPFIACVFLCKDAKFSPPQLCDPQNEIMKLFFA